MKTHQPWWSCAVVVVCLAFMLQRPLQVKAQDSHVAPDPAQGPQDSEDATQDPPGRVARLNYMEGSVSFQPGGENDWVDAVLNRPLATGDNLWADENSRAEVHVGSTALRLGAKTGITLLEVSDRAAQIRLAQGSLLVKVRHVDDEDSYEIDTPNVAFVVMQPGDYRIDVAEDGSRTEVTVWRGRGEVTGGGSSYTVVANQYATFTGTDHLDYELGQIPGGDEFDSWASDRDRTEDQSDSANYVSREMTGYEDLDEYGDWSYVAGYGTCWRPRVLVAGWAPYRFGQWAWVGPWGWTWVEDEPWGFAPFHYGRWAFAGGQWLWVPGPSVVRPVYAPALVAFVGGGGFGVSIGFGEGFAGVAWFPLGPRDVFVPSYRCSPRYWQNVNVTNSRVVTVTQVTNIYNTVHVNNVTNVTNVHYTYEHNAAAVTAVSRETFVNARPVAHANVKINETQLAAARVTDAAPLQPTRASYVSATAKPAPRSAQPPVPFSERKVVAKLPPPMPASSHDAPRVVSAGVSNSQSGARPTPTTVEANRNALPERPQPTPPQASRPEVYEKQNPPSARENEQQPNDRQNSAAQQHQQRTANDNRPPAEQQQHPAVKFTPPTRAKDQMYDVHPPLNEQQQQRPAQQQEKSSPPPQKQSPPPPAAHAEPSKPK